MLAVFRGGAMWQRAESGERDAYGRCGAAGRLREDAVSRSRPLRRE